MNNYKKINENNRLHDIKYYSSLYLKAYENNPIKIKQNYSLLVKLFHPDKNPSSIQKFHQINNSYQVLSNPALKFVYDNLGEEATNILKTKHKQIKQINKIFSYKDTPNNSELIQKYKEYILDNINQQKPITYPYTNLNVTYLGNSYGAVSMMNNISPNFSFEYIMNTLPYQSKQHKERKVIINYSHMKGILRLNHSLSITDINNVICKNELSFSNSRMFIVNDIALKKKQLEYCGWKIGMCLNENISILYDMLNKNINLSGKNNTYDIHYIVGLGLGKVFSVVNKNFKQKHSLSSLSLTFENKKIKLMYNVSNANKSKSKTILMSKVGFNMKKELNAESSLILSIHFNEQFTLNIPLLVFSTNKHHILSTLMFVFPFIYNVCLKYTYKRTLYSLFDKINFNNQQHFNSSYYSIYMNRILTSCNENDLNIIFAIIGNIDTIKYINKYRLDYSKYPNVFDIRFPLTKAIYNNKLIIPYNIFSIEGVYCPNYKSRHCIGVSITYKYKNRIKNIFIVNETEEVVIPIKE